MGLSTPRAEYLVIIALQTVNKIERYYPSRYTRVNELVTNRKNYGIKHPQNIYQLES